MKKTKIAIIQSEYIDANTDKNLIKFKMLIDNVEPDTEIAVFPELFLHGFVNQQEVQKIAEPVNGPSLSYIQEVANDKDLVIVIGFAESDGSHYYNSVAWVPPTGEISVYRKRHLWLSDRDIFTPGTDVTTISYRGFEYGLAICFDVEFPETGRDLAQEGANVFLISNGNMSPYGMVHRLAGQARALENHAYVVMSNRVGQSRNRVFEGGSMVVSPSGELELELGHDEAIEYVMLDHTKIAKSKKNYNYLELAVKDGRL